MSTPLSTAPRPKTDAVAQPTSGTATSRCMDEAAISESSSLKAFHCRPAPMQSKPIASEALPRCCKKVSAGTGSFRPAQFTARPKSVAMIRGFLRTVLMTDVRGRPDTARSRRKPRGSRQNSSQQNDQKVRQDKKHTVHLFSREPRPIPQGYRTFGNRGAPAPERSLKDRIRAGKKGRVSAFDIPAFFLPLNVHYGFFTTTPAAGFNLALAFARCTQIAPTTTTIAAPTAAPR